MSKPCSKKSEKANNPAYECNEKTGRYNLKKGYKKNDVMTNYNQSTQGKVLAAPKSAYYLWIDDHKTEINKQFPNLKGPEIGKKYSELWKNTSPDIIQKYKMRAERAKNDYKSQNGESLPCSKKSQYANDPAYECNEKTGRYRLKKRQYDKKSLLPKKPLSSYFLWLQDHRADFAQQYPDLKTTELSKLMSEQWKLLDESVKDRYKEQHQQDKLDYENKKSEIMEQYPDQPLVQIVRKEKKVPSGYLLYSGQRSKELRQQYKDVTDGKPKYGGIISKEWHDMSENDKKKWKDRSMKLAMNRGGQ